MTETATERVNADRLFLGSCVALIATSVAFATVGAVMLALKREFVLTNEEVGWIGGAALWGFAVSQLAFAPLADSLGMKTLLRFSFLGHLLGSVTMIFASGFTTLFVGALIIAMANGLVEAACNPLVAALFPDNKTVKLNQFHVWFPGGVVLGGLAAFALDAVGITGWQIKIGLILVPTLAYGALLLRETFPPTEGVEAGVSMGEMFSAAFTTPLMWVMLIAMAMTASVELGPNRWVPAVLEAGGVAGILVLVWINGLMAIMRFGEVLSGAAPKDSSRGRLMPMPAARTTLANFFSPLVNNVEQMFLTGQPTYPVERTLMTSGLVIAGVDSLHEDQVKIETPHLESVQYQPTEESTFWRT